MVNEKSKSDLVKEARELLSHLSEWPNSIPDIKHALFADAVERERDSPFFGCSTRIADLYGRAPKLLSSLCDEVEQLKSLNQTQAESIAEFQREQKEFRLAIAKCAIPYEALLADAGSRKWIASDVWASVQHAVKAARSAITPKGSEQQ